MMLIDCFIIPVCLSVVWLNKKRKYYTARAALICSHATAIFLHYKMMMDHTGLLFYYFPLLLVFLNFYNRKEERIYFGLSFAFLVLCILLGLIIPYSLFNPIQLSQSFHTNFFRFNIIASFSVSAFFVYQIFSDIIKREKWLVYAKKEAEEATLAKSTFLSNMSHELRTPINGIIGTSHILQNEQILPSQAYHLSVLSNLSAHMLGLVNNVLDFSKIDAGKLELNPYRFNLNAFVEKIDSTFRQQFEEKGISYKVTGNSLSLDLFADELRLQQIMFNLISNALKFTNANGNVSVTIACKKSEAENVDMHFSIVDDGIGIEEAQLEKIFESFRQGDSATTRIHGGSGLGLSISDSLVKQFGSKLFLKSIKGKGSEFYFDISLPIATSEIKSIEEQVISQNKLKDFKILLAEDNKVNMIVAKKIMQKWGIQITEAENGLIAYNKCEREDFDLLLLDLEMPVMDGRNALKKIQALGKNIPAIAFTAAVFDNMKESLLEIGFDDYMLKPFVPDDLYRKIIHFKDKVSN